MENICPVSGKPCNELKKNEVVETIEGQSKTFYLCDKCAASFFLDERVTAKKPSLPEVFIERTMNFIKSLNDILKKKCPNCGYTIQDIRQTGRLGCIHCHEFFAVENKAAEPEIIEQIEHENTSQLRDLEAFAQTLEKELENALRDENYETAIAIRKRILKVQKAIEKKKDLERQFVDAVKEKNFDNAKRLKRDIAKVIRGAIL